MSTTHPSAPSPDPLYRKLKPGPGQPERMVAANQRARIQGAMVELVSERGYGGVTVRGVTATSRVSSRTFYAHFANAEECFASTYGELMRTSLARLRAPGSRIGGWERALREDLTSLMEYFAENPKEARLTLVDAFSAGAATADEMGLAVRGFEQFLRVSFAAAPNSTPVPPPLIRGLAAGVEQVARTKVREGRQAELPQAAARLADWMLAICDPYVAQIAHPQGAGTSRFARYGLAASAATGPAVFSEFGSARSRALAAVSKLATQEGYSELTAAKVRKAAGVSCRAFNGQFESLDDCFLQAIEIPAVAAGARAQERAREASSWERGVWNAVLALCSEIAASPDLARLVFTEILAPGGTGLECRDRMVVAAAARLLELAPPRSPATSLSSEASVAAAWRIAEAEVSAGRGRALPKLAPLIALVILTPTLIRR